MNGIPNNRLLLPKLNDGDSTVPALDRAGTWGKGATKLLADVAASLKVPSLPETARSIDSIPDLWARPLLFRTALYDANHPLHQRILGEWRGLLAILALKERLGLSLFTQPLELTGTERSSFLRVAHRLLPSETLAENTAWSRLHLLFYGDPDNRDGTPNSIGMTSPTTLVCTAAELRGRLDSRVTWFVDGWLQDPVNVLSGLEKAALSDWLEQRLKEPLEVDYINPRDGKQRRLVSGLLNILQTYINALKRDAVVPSQQTQFNSRPLGLSHGIFNLLNQPVQEIERPVGESAVALVPSVGYSPAKQLLVLDRNLAAKWGVSRPSEVFLAGNETLASLDFDRLGTDPTTLNGKNLSALQAEWCRPEDFFTDKLLLTLSEGYQPFGGIEEIRGQRDLVYRNYNAVPVLPISTKLLDYYSPKDLGERLRITAGNKETILVELALTLAGYDGKPRTLLVQREYSGEDIVRRTEVPDLEVWPNFAFDQWKLYYTYNATDSTDRADVFFAKPYWRASEQVEVTDLRVEVSETDIREVTRSSKAPSLLLCEAYIKEKRVPVGCLVLKSLRKVTPVQDTWSFGVDFGRSASHVYVRRGDQIEPLPLHLKQHFFSVTPRQQQSQIPQIVKYFLPTFEPETPFATLYRPELTALTDTQKVPFLVGNIRYVKPGEFLKSGTLEIDRVKSRFKMGGSIEAKELTVSFLEQLALQCMVEAAAEGVTSVNWYVSYPSVLSKGLKNAFMRTWSNIKENAPTIGVTCQGVYEKTESEASALYFAQKEKVSLTEMICIDIGGGTSDISVMGRSILLQQSSVEFAGEAMFMNILRANPAAFTALGQDFASTIAAALSQPSYYTVIDSYLRSVRVRKNGREGDRLLDKLSLIFDSDNPRDPLYRFLHLLALGTSGVVFYAGLMLRYLEEQGKWSGDVLPNICVGGNGARIFSWLGQGQWDRDSSQNSLFQRVLKEASGLAERPGFTVKVSNQPKAEAVYGLLLPPKELKVDKGEEIQLSGENFLGADGQPLSWNENITGELLTQGLKVPNELTQLRAFVTAFNAYAATRDSLVCKINLPDLERDICNHLQEELDNVGGKEANDIDTQPLFIIALRKLLELETEKWANGK